MSYAYSETSGGYLGEDTTKTHGLHHQPVTGRFTVTHSNTLNNPLFWTDAYKLDHRRQYPEGTTNVYSNWTARGSRIEGIDWTVHFGLQAFLLKMGAAFSEWFIRDEDDVCAEYEAFTTDVLGPNDIGTDHIRALHKLGYLPLVFCSLPEGTFVPLRVPSFTVECTQPKDFAWLVNYIETMLSAELWLPTTSATQAAWLRLLLDGWADKTGDPSFVPWQGHDFSFRGMSSVEAAAASGAGHLLSFTGTDSLVSLPWIRANYRNRLDVPDDYFLGGSVAATEHSVMCAGGSLSERETFGRLLDLYPTGIVSVVSDTWDLWHVLTVILPSIKDEILSRDGKLVVRPDSGDPADIICGDPDAENGTPASFGVISLLWNYFGGTVNEKGYRVLDPHVGAIYGDSITYARANDICARLAAKGFASTNIVYGVGSFTYQHVTRDTFGFAMKATWAEVNGEGRDLFKDPVTDDGLKRSAKGRLAVIDMVLINQATPEQEAVSQLRPIWKDGGWLPGGFQDFSQIRERVQEGLDTLKSRV